MNRTILAFAVLFTSLGSVSAVAGVTLEPGVTLQFTFSTNPIGVPCPGVCDTLFFSLEDGSAIGNPVTTVELFDGNTLLGSFTTPPSCCAFVASGSVFGFGAPVVDFTTINNGTIDGIIDVSVTGGSIPDVSLTGVLLNLGTSTDRGGLDFNSGSATFISGSIITPEPSSLYLSAVGAFLIAFARRKSPGACQHRNDSNP